MKKIILKDQSFQWVASYFWWKPDSWFSVWLDENDNLQDMKGEALGNIWVLSLNSWYKNIVITKAKAKWSQSAGRVQTIRP